MLERHRGAEADEDGQLVHTLVGGAVEVEDVLAAVDIGGREAQFQDGTGSEGEFAFYAEVQTVVTGQSSLVELAVVDAVLAVLRGIVAVDAVGE